MTAMNIMIVGVGGQGTLLASRVLGAAALDEGYEVKVSEVHGMAQRGGSVVTYVRYGASVASPIINEGEADILLAFEQLEAARWLRFLKKGGTLIANTQTIDPMPVITGAAVYPSEILQTIAQLGVKLCSIDGLSVALECGSEKAVNVVLIGAMAGLTAIPRETWEKAVAATVPAKFRTLNLEAFEKGYAAGCAVLT